MVLMLGLGEARETEHGLKSSSRLNKAGIDAASHPSPCPSAWKSLCRRAATSQSCAVSRARGPGEQEAAPCAAVLGGLEHKALQEIWGRGAREPGGAQAALGRALTSPVPSEGSLGSHLACTARAVLGLGGIGCVRGSSAGATAWAQKTAAFS